LLPVGAMSLKGKSEKVMIHRVLTQIDLKKEDSHEK
jgi:hypothetical protein